MGYGDDVLREVREELGRADGKASILLAAFGVAGGALVAALLANSWSPSQLDDRFEWIWWLGIASAICSLAFLAASVYPRTRRKDASSVVGPMYYGDVVAMDKKALSRSLDNPPADRLADQIFEISHIVAKKYQFLRWGLLSAGAAGVFCLVAALLNLGVAR